MNKKLYIFFSLTSFAYMLSVSVYLLNSFIMLNDTIFAVTRILMICCLLIFLLFGLKLKTIAKIEGNNQTLTKFQHIQKVWSIVIITSLITINEQISNFAQTYPTNLKASSNEALLFMRRYRFANCSCFSCCFKDAYPSSNVQ